VGAKVVIHVDFQNADSDGRVRLNTRAAIRDLEALQHPLTEGMQIELIDGELSSAGTATMSPTEGIWTAVIDWDAVTERDG